MQKEEKEIYYNKIKNWDSPIIATSAVQFLNCLFSKKYCDIRRFNTLSNSVIIIDEIQFLPIKCTYLFNLSINFISQICKTDVILCSATQPPFEELEYKIKDIKNITDAGSSYINVNPRVNILLNEKNINSEKEFGNYLKNKLDSNVLIIVNTKRCAFKIYNYLSEDEFFSGYTIFHLSTNMCPAHRKEVLSEIKKSLNNNEKIICVSTKLIEAGVDISFKTVIRSMSGIDNIIQSSGRCNRNNEYYPEKGTLYVVNFSNELENINSLKDVKEGKNASEVCFHYYNKNLEKDNNLLSDKLISRYYNEYFYSRKNEMIYEVKDKNLDSNLLELFSVNTEDCRYKLIKQNKKIFMCQAPKTAGEYFEAIDDGQKIDFIVYYKDSKDLISKLYSEIEVKEKLEVVQQLQSYCVSLYKNEFRKCKYQQVMLFENYEINILNQEYYDENVGVIKVPRNLDFMCY